MANEIPANTDTSTARTGMPSLPPEVEEVFKEFRTCELSTLTRDGSPVAWPLIPLWRPQEERFVLTTSIGLPRKASNVRRDGRVSLLFSESTASGIENPPTVLVQGDAEIAGEVRASPAGFEDYWERIFRVQPAGKMYGAIALMRYLMGWYYMRLYISVRPRRILWWPDGDPTKAPLKIDYVG
ncbi:MAG: hypothetical protein AVDCRST_MAG25-869 [uncultured Rubrobacteraceae bacterium]|uniref:Pyridoxamine 5'-phosphate oxidase N-terminal domain-containing protein n=1 Tax=uncultured Rubrobacteraceae bacterium TaxID=349277 RepID=A0A6J4R7B9_9ACTN|nr:MAG: hypothetical protein AVDCRST_MAG25-869 [uncultured Rubrobacteraceae bacterium]